MQISIIQQVKSSSLSCTLARALCVGLSAHIGRAGAGWLPATAARAHSSDAAADADATTAASSSSSTSSNIYEAAYDPECRNAVVLTGNVGTKLQLRTLPNNGCAAKIDLAVAAGKQKTYWFKVDVYGALAQQAVQQIDRGSKIVIHGYLQQDEWQSKTTGTRRSAVKIVARQIGKISEYDSEQGDIGAEGQVSGSTIPNASGSAPPGSDGSQQQLQQHQAPQAEQELYSQARGQSDGGASARVPLPMTPANDIEALWLSVIQNPQDWWDNRQDKRNPRAPDWRSKRGNDALWIDSRTTPAWVQSNLPPLKA